MMKCLVKERKTARWRRLEERRKSYCTAVQVGLCLIFDIMGNSYKLISAVSLRNQRILSTIEWEAWGRIIMKASKRQLGLDRFID